MSNTAVSQLLAGTASTALRDAGRWRRGLAVDIGSTNTKVSVIEPDGRLVEQATATTTIDSDVTRGLLEAVDKLSEPRSFDWVLTCSSGAGGLRMVSIGLTLALSGRAGMLAALGAGGKIVGSEAGLLDDAALVRISEADPHLVLLAGGVDGGNEEGILHNAQQLSRLSERFGVIVAGNTDVAQRAAALLAARSDAVRVVPNVFPRPGEIDIAPTREAVGDLFMRHITKAKGLDGMLAALRCECEPTPVAVSRGLATIRRTLGVTSVLVDVGGATTDVHSAGGGSCVERGVDLPVPDVMRTVEGDLGMRWGAPGIAQALGGDVTLTQEADRRRRDPSFLPVSDTDRTIERMLAVGAVRIALERHAGRVVVRHKPWGDRYHVTGKDLRDCSLVLATGGVFVHQELPHEIVTNALESIEDGFVPRDPTVIVDRGYSMYAIGLVSVHSADLAAQLSLELMKEEPV